MGTVEVVRRDSSSSKELRKNDAVGLGLPLLLLMMKQKNCRKFKMFLFYFVDMSNPPLSKAVYLEA